MQVAYHKPSQEARKASSAIAAAVFAVFVLLLSAILGAQILAKNAAQSRPRDESPVPLSEVIPIPCHSHNDFWRRIPLYSALQAGCIGVEADVWPYKGELYIAHTRGDLSTGHTLASLYVEPLTHLLQKKPPRTPSSLHGFYDSDPTQTLVLLVDVKTKFDSAWPLLLDALQPLRQQGWLSHLQHGRIFMGAVTVVITGDEAVMKAAHAVLNVTNDIFLDAPLSKLDSTDLVPENYFWWASSSFVQSVGRVWTGSLRSSQVDAIRHHVRTAHDQGLEARYWGLPTWPGSVQKHVLETLVREGVDIINVDNLDTVVPWIRSQTVPGS